MASDGRSFEDILSAVEGDEALRGASLAGSASGASTGGSAVQDGADAGAGASLLGAMPPELLAKLPQLLRALSTMTEPLPHAAGRPESPEALLCALRPYLNEQRRQLIDTMIRLARLSGTLGALR